MPIKIRYQRKNVDLRPLWLFSILLSDELHAFLTSCNCARLRGVFPLNFTLEQFQGLSEEELQVPFTALLLWKLNVIYATRIAMQKIICTYESKMPRQYNPLSADYFLHCGIFDSLVTTSVTCYCYLNSSPLRFPDCIYYNGFRLGVLPCTQQAFLRTISSSFRIYDLIDNHYRTRHDPVV